MARNAPSESNRNFFGSQANGWRLAMRQTASLFRTTWNGRKSLTDACWINRCTCNGRSTANLRCASIQINVVPTSRSSPLVQCLLG